MIEVKNLSKSFGGNIVLDDISFTVEAKEFVCLTGPSGAGKTTLIEALIGAIKIDEGKIKVDHFEVEKLNESKMQEYRRKIGIIFQDYKLLAKKTVFENVAFALEVCGYPQDFIDKRTTEVLKITGLEDKRNYFPNQLSGGEKQRTAIARALVHTPDLIIADEPTGNLDQENAIALANLLVKINKSGTTVILSTHNQEIVDALKTRVITIENGRIVSDKTINS